MQSKCHRKEKENTKGLQRVCNKPARQNLKDWKKSLSMKTLKWLQGEIREERTIERKVGSTANVHQLMNGRSKCGKSIQYIIQE